MGLLFITQMVIAQEGDPFKSTGRIPDELFLSTVEKYNKKKKEALKANINQPRELRQSQGIFYQSSYFIIDAIKSNAGIYINDELTIYINKIADEILKDDPVLRSKLHFYSYRSPYANAFSTDQGDIFVTVGLLAYLHNEAELAFILCHEIVHFKKQHNIVKFTETAKAELGMGKYKDVAVDESIEAIHGFSRELETEADLKGMQMFLKTKYDIKSVATMFDALEASSLPFRNDKFDPLLIGTDFFSIPEKFLPKKKEKEQIESDDEDDEDKSSSHPHIDDRRQYTSEFITEENLKSSNITFLHKTETEFALLTEKAKHAMCYYYFDNGQYVKCMYLAYLLNIQTPKEEYVKLMMKSSYTAMMLKNKKKSISEKRWEVFEGEEYPLYHLLYKSKKETLGSINFLIFWSYLSKNPTDSFWRYATLLSLNEMVNACGKNWSSYQSNNFDTTSKTSEHIILMMPYLKKAFNEPLFKQLFGNISDYKFNPADKEENQENDFHKISKQAEPPGIKSLLIINPFYLREDAAVDGGIDFITAYSKETIILNHLKYASNKAGIKTSIVDARIAGKYDGEIFDEIAVATSYFDKFAEIAFDTSIAIMPSSEKRIEALSRKYDARYFMYFGMRSYRGGVDYDNMWVLAWVAIFPNLLPQVIMTTFAKYRKSEYYYLIVDSQTGKVVTSGYLETEGLRDNTPIVTRTLYEIFKTLN